MKKILLIIVLSVFFINNAMAFDMGKFFTDLFSGIPTAGGKIDDKKLAELKTSNKCPEHYPFGIPIMEQKINERSFFLCRMGYAVQYDTELKVPRWVAEVLEASKINKKEQNRSENFQEDPNFPEQFQATLQDYKKSGFDRGHMAPAGDMRYDKKAMEESFYLTNMIPQIGPDMNRGIWSDLETKIRGWAIKRGNLLVVTGPIYFNSKALGLMGKSQVAVPTHLYKIVVDPKTFGGIAFIMPNERIPNEKSKSTPEDGYYCNDNNNTKRFCRIEDFIVTIREVERLTSINFNSKLNQNDADKIENNVSGMWRK